MGLSKLSMGKKVPWIIYGIVGLWDYQWIIYYNSDTSWYIYDVYFFWHF